MTITIENYSIYLLFEGIPYKTPNTLLYPQYPQNIFDEGVRYHDVLVDLVHFLEVGKIQISLKLDFCGANEDDIWNQRPRLRRNRLILVDKAGGILLTSCQFRNTYSFTI